MDAKRQTKHGPKKVHALVRGEPVVQGVLGATLEELGRVGYGALRIEEVAARAGVNKTTVYRRWPTKQDLVRAALESFAEGFAVVPNTGSLRGDLLDVARRMVELGKSLRGTGLLRIMILEGRGSELHAIAESLRTTHEGIPRAVLDAAAARGELRPGVDGMQVWEALIGAVNRTVFLEPRRVDDAYLSRLVDLLLMGALAADRRA